MLAKVPLVRVLVEAIETYIQGFTSRTLLVSQTSLQTLGMLKSSRSHSDGGASSRIPREFSKKSEVRKYAKVIGISAGAVNRKCYWTIRTEVF